MIDPAIVSFERTEKGRALAKEHGGDATAGTSESLKPIVTPADAPPLPQKDVSSNQIALAFRPPQVGKPLAKALAPSPDAQREPKPSQLNASILPQQNGLLSCPTQNTRPATDATPSATLTAPFSEPSLNANLNNKSPNPATRDKVPKIPSYKTQPILAREEFFAPRKASKRGKRSAKAQVGHGTRQAMAKNTTNHLNLQPHGSLEAGNKTGIIRSKNKDHWDQNGWATGDATDIQDMGDFDFEQNLNKFDKRKVFDEIRQGDTTADEDRLHTFNRRTRPGTGGGKNLHHTENVLDSPRQTASAEQSSADDEANISENRRKMNRSVVTRKAPSRQGSSITATEGHVTASGSLSGIREGTTISKVSSSNVSHAGANTTHSLSRRTSNQLPRPYLKIADSNSLCPSVSPLQMLELEQLAISEFDLTEEILTENAGRSIAEAALSIAQSTSDGMTAHGSLIVILVGNTKTGSRAIAAARHLRNRGVRVVPVIIGLDLRENLLELVRRQLKIYSNCGGKVFKPEQLKGRIRSANAPVDLVIDAMLGMHLSYDNLTTQDQASYHDLMSWTNNQAVAVLSIDIPSGIDASTGKLIPFFCFYRSTV